MDRSYGSTLMARFLSDYLDRVEAVDQLVPIADADVFPRFAEKINSEVKRLTKTRQGTTRAEDSSDDEMDEPPWFGLHNSDHDSDDDSSNCDEHSSAALSAA